MLASDCASWSSKMDRGSVECIFILSGTSACAKKMCSLYETLFRSSKIEMQAPKTFRKLQYPVLQWNLGRIRVLFRAQAIWTPFLSATSWFLLVMFLAGKEILTYVRVVEL